MSLTRFARRRALAGLLAGVAGASLLAACGKGSTADPAAPALRQPGARKITPADLPAPYATPSVDNGPRVVPRPAGASLTVPAGFQISEWATDLDNPRVLTVAPNGDVFVAESGPGRVVVLRDADGDGKPEMRSEFASDLSKPFGIAFYPLGPTPQYVYVANTDSVVRFPYRRGDLKARGASEMIVSNIPGGGRLRGGGHWSRDIAFSPDGKKMYVSVGSLSNVGEGPSEERRANILEFNPDGTGERIYAAGLRNAVGIEFNPVSKQLWAAVNERDTLGDELVPDYVTSVKPGGFYGWPYYYIGPNHDPRMRERPELKARTIVPDVLLESHCAALSVTFTQGRQFPAAYKNDAFVGLHGSWNRSHYSGYKVVRVPIDSQGRAKGVYEDFVTGWVTPGGAVWGRPVDVAFARDGSMLITDDGANKIWRVAHGAKTAARK